MTVPFRVAAHLTAILAFALGLWGWQASERSAAAQPKTSKRWAARADPANSAATPTRRRRHGIAVVVNDEIITGYDIEQRARFLGLSASISAQAKERFNSLVKAESTTKQLRALQEKVIRNNPGKSKEELIAIFKERQKQFGAALQEKAIASARAGLLPKLRKEAKQKLIDDRLKLQAAKKLGIVVTDEDVKRYLKDVASRNKMTYEQFAQHLKGMGVNIATMGAKFRAQRAWRELIGRRYSAQVSVSQRDIDRVLSANAIEAGKDTVELHVQRISLGLSGEIDQTALAKRYSEADALRRRFDGCKTMKQLANSVRQSKFVDMKYIKPAAIGEPMRSMLLSAKDNDILPPVTTSDGVELYAVCGRRSISGNDAQRAKAKRELQAKELDILARRHLRNLRQEANIEHK